MSGLLENLHTDAVEARRFFLVFLFSKRNRIVITLGDECIYATQLLHDLADIILLVARLLLDKRNQRDPSEAEIALPHDAIVLFQVV